VLAPQREHYKVTELSFRLSKFAEPEKKNWTRSSPFTRAQTFNISGES